MTRYTFNQVRRYFTFTLDFMDTPVKYMDMYIAVARVPVQAITILKFAVPVVFKLRISKVYK